MTLRLNIDYCNHELCMRLDFFWEKYLLIRK